MKDELVKTEIDGKTYYSMPRDRYRFNLKCRDDAIGPGNGGSFLIYNMVSQFENLGIRLLTGLRATQILTDESGAVCGVVAQDEGGVTEIKCKAVIVSTGGFARNDELLKKYWPWFFSDNTSDEPTHRFAAPTNTGDVVGLGESAGAYIDHDNFFVNLFGPVHHPFNFCLFQFGLQPEIISVNTMGKRYFNEGSFSNGAGPILDQPGRIAYGVIDSETLKVLAQRQNYEGWEEAVAKEAELGIPLKVADTIEELAEKCGMDVEAFKETVERYNHFCETGVDEDFGKPAYALRPIKTAPFYAIYGKTATDGAFGGILINAKAEAYKADKSGVVPGLYATGDNAAGWAISSHSKGDNRMMATNEMGWAATSGYIAGTNAAEYITK